MKKETTPKTQRGSSKKTLNKKRGNPKKCIETHKKRPLMKKEATQKTKRVSSKKDL
jgi:hypothetical protein